MHPVIEVLKRTPMSPDAKTTRTVLASVFNVDLDEAGPLPPHQIITVMAYKILHDMGISTEHLIHILRYYRNGLAEWDVLKPGVLSLSDNRYAVLYAGKKQYVPFNYRDDDLTRPSEPVFEVSVNLRALSGLLVKAMAHLQTNQPSGEATEAGSSSAQCGIERIL